MVFFPFAWLLSEQDDGSKRQKSRSRRRRNSTKKNTVEINFTQTFKSDEYSDIGLKKLIWVKNGSDWRRRSL